MFKRFYEASSLKGQSVATQQGYMLQALNHDLQEVVEQKLTPGMQMFGPAGCLDLLEGEFQILYPIFNRRVEYFQVAREKGESSEEFSSLSHQAVGYGRPGGHVEGGAQNVSFLRGL